MLAINSIVGPPAAARHRNMKILNCYRLLLNMMSKYRAIIFV